MKRALNDQERLRLDQRVAEVEKRTGVQIVLSVIERCDSYSELPWKAFALGAAIVGLSISAVDMLRPGWASGTSVLFAVATTLAAGIASGSQ